VQGTVKFFDNDRGFGFISRQGGEDVFVHVSNLAVAGTTLAEGQAVEFEITDRKVDDETHVITVTGEIDLFTAPEFKQRMSELIDAGRSRLVVDLTDTTFIDSSSLGVLIGAHRRLKLRGGALLVVCESEAIAKTFKITGLDGVFTLASSVEQALSDDTTAA